MNIREALEKPHLVTDMDLRMCIQLGLIDKHNKLTAFGNRLKTGEQTEEDVDSLRIGLENWIRTSSGVIFDGWITQPISVRSPRQFGPAKGCSEAASFSMGFD